MESNSSGTKVQALMGMALRGRWSREERKEDGEGERPPSSIILLIREIRFGESIRPKIKSSLFHTDRDGSWRKSLLRRPPPRCGSSILRVWNGAALPSAIGLLIASFCAT